MTTPEDPVTSKRNHILSLAEARANRSGRYKHQLAIVSAVAQGLPLQLITTAGQDTTMHTGFHPGGDLNWVHGEGVYYTGAPWTLTTEAGTGLVATGNLDFIKVTKWQADGFHFYDSTYVYFEPGIVEIGRDNCRYNARFEFNHEAKQMTLTKLLFDVSKDITGHNERFRTERQHSFKSRVNLGDFLEVDIEDSRVTNAKYHTNAWERPTTLVNSMPTVINASHNESSAVVSWSTATDGRAIEMLLDAHRHQAGWGSVKESFDVQVATSLNLNGIAFDPSNWQAFHEGVFMQFFDPHGESPALDSVFTVK